MQYLMVLLVIVGVFVSAVAVVLGISYALGVMLRSRGGAQAGATGADPCAQFQADRDWYEEQPMWKRNIVTAWWLANRYQCASRGCN